MLRGLQTEDEDCCDERCGNRFADRIKEDWQHVCTVIPLQPFIQIRHVILSVTYIIVLNMTPAESVFLDCGSVNDVDEILL